MATRTHLAIKRSSFFLLAVLMLPAPSLFSQLGLRLPETTTPLAPIIISRTAPAYSLSVPLSMQPVQYPKNVTQKVTLDSTGQFITATYRLGGLDLLYPVQIPLETYIHQRAALDAQYQWKQFAFKNMTPEEDAKDRRGGLTISSPKIKNKTFQRIFGGDDLSLNVTGNITIDGSMRKEDREQALSATNRSNNTSFRMKQTQKFKVEGKIGENVSVLVDQDSERPFDFENALKIKYTGDEDGIIQSIEAGNVTLSLPGTRFVTFSASNSGLFGFKTQLKVGKIDITTIASMEKGKKSKITLSGGGQAENTQKDDYQYIQNTYFFLDSLYRKYWPRFTNDGLHYSVKQVKELEVYKSVQTPTSNSSQMWASWDPDNAQLEEKDKNEVQREFILLQPDIDYTVDVRLGYITMKTSLSSQEVLAVAYRDSVVSNPFNDPDLNTSQPLRTHGHLSSDNPDTRVLKLLKTQSPTPGDKTWYLEWKNAYRLGGRNLTFDDLEIKIFKRSPSGEPLETMTINGETKGFLEIFGLDVRNNSGQGSGPDQIIDPNYNFVDLANGVLFFPDLLPFNPYENPDATLPESEWGNFYDAKNNQEIQSARPGFYIEVNTQSRSPVIELGMNVMENSESVMLGSQKLVKGVDYSIEYFTGTLTILNETALAPDANLEITYESQEMFSIDKKMLLGARAEYNIWEKDDNRAFLGATALYMSQKSLDRKVRLGRESPFSNFVWDVNASLKFNSDLLTRGINLLPFVNETASSVISLEGEVAQVIPNPNTLGNKDTGDEDGVAYLDDFEGSTRETTFSLLRQAWTPASLPFLTPDSQLTLDSNGRLFSYTPIAPVSIKEIWPNRETTAAMGGKTNTQVLEFRLYTPPGKSEQEITQYWAGIQQALSSGYSNQTNSRFLKIMVKGHNGKIHVDLGRVSEDFIPYEPNAGHTNSPLNTEDKVRGGIREGVLTDDEDTGVDGVFGDDPPLEISTLENLFYPHVEATIDTNTNEAFPYDFWDLNGNLVKEANEPWSFDNYKSYTNAGHDFFTSGTEKNATAHASPIPDTEDRNGNQIVDMSNDYYSYSFNLDTTHSDINLATNKTGGWRMYTIPLDDPDFTIGNPNWSQIEFIRIWVDSLQDKQTAYENNFSSFSDITIAEIKLEGNEWQLGGTKFPWEKSYSMDQDSSTLEIKVYNTHENPEYTPPAGVEGELDPVLKIRAKEQSLVMSVNELESQESVIAEKRFYKSKSLMDYKTLKMFIHGGNTNELDGFGDEWPSDSAHVDVEFFLQLGSGTNNNHYYEVRFPVYAGWDERNNIKVDMSEFNALKLQAQADFSDTTLVAENGHRLTIAGKPSLTKVDWMIIGLKYKGGPDSDYLWSGEVWLDELRVSSVRKDKGMAVRARGDITLGNGLLKLSGEFNKKDADFHTVNERFGKGNDQKSIQASASLQLQKLLPSSLGLSIPVSVSYSKSEALPKYMPGSDILVDTFVDENGGGQKGKQAALDSVGTINQRQGFNVSLKKVQKSNRFWGRFLLDPWSVSYNYAQSEQSSSQIRESETKTQKASVGYNLSFGRQAFWEPFKWLGPRGFFSGLAKTKFYYAQTTMNMKYDWHQNETFKEMRTGITNAPETEKLTRNFTFSYKPFGGLYCDFSQNKSLNLLFDPNSTWSDFFMDFFTKDSEADSAVQSFTQNASVTFNPKFASWLSPKFKYSSNYRWNDNINMRHTGASKSASVSRNITTSVSLDPGRFVDAFKSKKKAPVQRTARRRRRTPKKANDTDVEKDDASSEKEKKEKKPFPLLFVTKALGAGIKKINPINISVTIGDVYTHPGVMGASLSDISLAYQLGLQEDPGVAVSPNVTQPPSFKNDNRITMRSGIKMINSMTLSLDFSYSKTDNRAAQNTSSESYSSLEGLGKFKLSYFPGWTYNWRGLEKLPLINKVIKSFTLNHGFSGKTTLNYIDGLKNQATINSDFRPLVGVNITSKNNISTNFQYNTSTAIQEQYSNGLINGKTKRVTSNITLSASYKLKGGLKLPFFKKKLDNTVDISLSFQLNNNETYQARKTGTSTEEQELILGKKPSFYTKNWSLKPNINYTFSRTVRGGLYLEFGKREDTRAPNSKIFALGINTNISLAGR